MQEMKLFKKHDYYALITVALIMLAIISSMWGCAATQFTPQQHALWAVKIYNAEYQDLLRDILKPDLPPEVVEKVTNDPSLLTSEMFRKDISEDEMEIIEVRWEILKELEPLIPIIGQFGTGEAVSSNEFEDAMMQAIELINRLLEED